MSYRILRQLSGGGFSDVFEVEDPASALPERLILKRLNAEMSARPEVRAAFSDEAKILRELKHPNIVTFRRCYFDESQRVCLLMEKVVGEPLDAWARRHASQPDRVLDVFEQVLQAVDYLHRRASPFLHLDLKPDNIQVSSSSQGTQPVLIDFGIARRSGGKGLKAYTPPYGAPEQETGGTLDCATDVHALGQILVELLESLGLPESPVREALAAVSAKARNPSRRQRFADAGEMGLAFRRARRSSPSPASKPLPIPTLPRLPRWTYGAGAAVLGIALLAGVLAMREPSSTAQDALAEENSAAEDPLARERFDGLLSEAKQATREGKFVNADRYYMEARRLWEAIPPEGDAARAMERDLTSLRSQIDLVRQGGLEGERVRMEMK
jgi:serine/threonine protein kinase